MARNSWDPEERALEEKFFNTIRALGGMSMKMVPTLAGPPDRLVILAGRMHLVELKTETGTVSAIQRHWHARSLARGVPVYVVYGKEGLRSWLKALVELDNPPPRPGRKPNKPKPAVLERTEWRGLPEEYERD